MAKIPELLEAAEALIAELERELRGWAQEDMSSEKRTRVSQMQIVLNSCEMGDLRRSIERHKRITKKLKPKAA